MEQLSDAEIRRRLAWPEVLRALKTAFANRQDFVMPERVAMSGPENSSYLTMPCADAAGYFGVKQVAVVPSNAGRAKPTVQAHYTLFDPEGSPRLSFGATLLTRLRTAAVSALAAEYLARRDAETLLVVGTGSLAPWMAEAHAQVRDYRHIAVWGRSPEKAARSAADIAERLSYKNRLTVEPASDLAAALQRADVTSVATTATEPIIEGGRLKAGQHLDLVGAFIPAMAEADAEAVQSARVYVDDREAARQEAGDLIRATSRGWSFDAVQASLDEVVRQPPERPADALTLFKSVGLALEDLVVARLLLGDFPNQ